MLNTLGHEKAINTLRRALDEGRVSHAYLFVGPQGVGKMTLAMDLARMVNCVEQGERPCGACVQCRRIADGLHADVRVISLGVNERDGRTRTAITIDQVREVQREASLKPYEGSYRVFVFDGAERLSDEAANSLLKILEEPPEQVILVLLAPEASALLPTITSRCQTVELHPLPLSKVAQELESRHGADSETAVEIARLSRGMPGWAFRAAASPEMLASRAETLATVERVTRGALEERFAYAAELATRFGRGRESVYQTLELWLEWWRDALVIKEGVADYVTNLSRMDELRSIAERLAPAQIVGAIKAVQKAVEHLERNVNARLALENLMLALPRV